jgi:selenocysteine-specific elongation factor
MRPHGAGRIVTARVVATAGHVDHGKSTLVRALTGMEPDRLAEERRRGLTIDLGFAWTRLASGTDLAFVDVPGHERFVTTMLAGAGPVPAVLMVVAADEGWMPQSDEHLDALDALGVEHGLLAITRCDLLDPEPAREDALAEIAGSSLGTVGVAEVCAPHGEGLDVLRTALDGLVAAVPEPDPHADVRLWVDRAFTIRGAGTVVTGTLGAGTIKVGDELELRGRRVHVRGLQSLGEPVESARGVTRIAVNLRGVPREVVARGDALLTPDAWLTPAEIDVALRGVRGAEPGQLPREVILHVGSAAVAVHVRPLGSGFARLRPERPLPMRIGDTAVLRDPGRRAVVAGVVVLDVLPPALRRRGAAARRAVELAEPDVGTAAGELRRRGLVRAADLVAMGVPRAEVDTLPVVRADG